MYPRLFQLQRKKKHLSLLITINFIRSNYRIFQFQINTHNRKRVEENRRSFEEKIIN